MRERTIDLDHDGVRAEVRVRLSSRARRARLLVHGDGSPEVVVPAGLRGADPERLVAANADWLAHHVRLRRERAAAAPTLVLDREGHLPLGGGWMRVLHVGGRAGRTRIERHGGEAHVSGPVGGASADAALERWYREQARASLAQLVGAEGDRLGLRATRITIRDQRTRWASCSRSGALSFSWRLVLAPSDVVRYVVVHELCHLAEPNHGPRFWALVDAALPGWKEQRAWLATHGDAVHRWRPAFPLDLCRAAARAA